MRVPDLVYHASSVQGLTRLLPSESTHGRWVYAVRDEVLAACFLSTLGGDLTCAIGRDRATRTPYLCERYAGAFEQRYAGTSGSIYRLNRAGFLTGRTPWEEEVVCPDAVGVRDEIRIDDAAEWLEALEEADRLLLVRYPERIDGIPDDDSDLIERAVVWRRQFGEDVLDGFATYHPSLLPRIRRAIDGEAAR
jgi:hypothetical protein